MIPEFKSVSEINAWLKSIRPQREAVYEELKRIVAENQREPNLQAKVAIIGSFKFKPQIDEVIERLENAEIEVLVPSKGKVVRVDANSNFPMMEGDAGKGPMDVEDDFMRGLARANVIYLVNPDGYSGSMTAFEWGSAFAWNKLVISMKQINWPGEEGHHIYEMLRLDTLTLTVDELIDKIKKKEL